MGTRLTLTLLALASCGIREPVPPGRVHDARFGYLAGEEAPPPKERACRSFMWNVVRRDEHALTHVSFPETNVQDACFVRVEHRGDDFAKATDAPPRGCAFPDPVARARIHRLIHELDEIASRPSTPSALFDCGLREEDKRASAEHNANALRAVLADERAYPYSAIIVPGHGLAAQGSSKLTAFRPGDECMRIEEREHEALGGLMPRTRRALALLRGGVAPLAIVSGAAVHSPLSESFAMLHLISCPRADLVRTPELVPLPPTRVLLEPCADHTHTNLRNSARWIVKMGGRAGYLVTDDFIQSRYFQDQNGFELLLGSIDQRSLRDFGYVIGSWRQASTGNDAGFWFTPYRFWAEPRDGLGSMSCVDVE